VLAYPKFRLQPAAGRVDSPGQISLKDPAEMVSLVLEALALAR
jgi:hypothetical protein